MMRTILVVLETQIILPIILTNIILGQKKINSRSSNKLCYFLRSAGILFIYLFTVKSKPIRASLIGYYGGSCLQSARNCPVNHPLNHGTANHYAPFPVKPPFLHTDELLFTGLSYELQSSVKRREWGRRTELREGWWRSISNSNLSHSFSDSWGENGLEEDFTERLSLTVSLTLRISCGFFFLKVKLFMERVVAVVLTNAHFVDVLAGKESSLCNIITAACQQVSSCTSTDNIFDRCALLSCKRTNDAIIIVFLSVMKLNILHSLHMIAL